MLMPPKRIPLLGALVLLGAFLPALAQAQAPAPDLATLAKKEKERRAKVSKPVKVLTEEDGKEAATKGSGSFTALSAESTNAEAPTEASAAGADSEGQKASWKQRADGARAAVTNTEKTLATLEKDLSAYRSDMVPTSAKDLQDPMREQKRTARMYEMTKQIEAQKVAIADAKKALAAFEEEARSKGIPPGWLR